MLRDENVKQQEITKNTIVLIAGSRASRSNDVPTYEFDGDVIW